MNKLNVIFDNETQIKIGKQSLTVRDWVFPMLVLRAIANPSQMASDSGLEITFYPNSRLFNVRFYSYKDTFKHTHDCVVELPTMTDILVSYENYRNTLKVV